MSYHNEFNEPLNEDDSDKIDSDCSFNSSNFIFKPIRSKRCTINENTVQLHHSFGYDCCFKMFNICAADEHTVVYAAGSYINMFDINNSTLTFRKCAGNGGIGHITKNPVLNHIAVGENGSSPLIIVYEWPTFKIISVLKGSTKRQNNCLTYNQNGNYLCSQGGEPDNTLTIWDWKKSKIVLRTKSHTQDVHICRFSTFIFDHLVTAGSGHIKFWKMANTFTGLKLQGRLGCFGKTEISNVIGFFSMPDEKVISSCDWGNILVWDEEIIDIEVMRKGRKPCHLAPIIMFLYSEDKMELTSISMDGTIKYWYYQTIDIADPPEKDRVLEMEPSFTIKIQDSIGIAKIMGMCKVNDNPNSYDYFIQDGNGGIWLADIEVSANAKPLKRLAKFHGDVITSLQTSPIGYFIATTSLDGWFHLYSVKDKTLVFMHNFNVPITSLIWLPLKVARSGNIFVIGFQTGILKIVAVPLKEIFEEKTLNLIEIQISKPHNSSIKHLTVNRCAKILVCGSDDCSIFVYEINSEPIKLNAIGMYPLPGKVTFIHWKPSEEQTALISCASGHIIEVNIPTSRPSYTKESFLLKLESRIIETVSNKSRIFCNKHILDSERKKKEKKNVKIDKLQIIKEDNFAIEIDKELYFENSNNDESPKIFIPPIQNPVLFAIYTPSEKTLWVSIDGFDAGFLYEYDFNSIGPINTTMIPDKNNISLTAIKMFGTDSLTMLMGFADGSIRVTNIKAEDIYDMSDYIEYSVHDNKTGRVTSLCFSQDNRMLFTYGDDGNIFSFIFQCENSVIEQCMLSISELPQLPQLIDEDIIKTKEDIKLSLEEKKVNKEKHKALNLANKEKDRISYLLYGLKENFKQVLIKNMSLPEPLQFSHNFFQFDERINNSLIKEAQSEMDKLHLKLTFDYEKSLLGLTKVKNYFVDNILTTKFEVKAILKNTGVKTIYHEVHHNLFSCVVEEFLSKKHPKRYLEEIKYPNNIRRKSTLLDNSNDGQMHKVTESEIFLRNIREIYPTLPKRVQSAIDKFAARVDFENQEILKIKSMHNEKPNNTNIEVEDIINNAWDTIGNLNLKTASDFKPFDDQVISMEDKFEQYKHVQKEVYNLKSNFNEKVFDLRQRKIRLIYDYKQFMFDVYLLQNELNEETMTSIDSPEVLIDESIDPHLIDSIGPIHHLDSMYVILNPDKSNLYMEMSKHGFHENPTHLETIMQQMRKDKLKYRYKCLHESMLTKINIFDDYLIMLETQRKDVKLRITFLDIFASTLEEEMIIFNNYHLLEDEYMYNVHEKTEKINEIVIQIQTIREDINNLNKINENKSNILIDIQHTFDMEVRNNDFAKHLRKIFKKKFKTPKVKSDDRNDSLSSSSSNGSDYSELESIKNESGDSLTMMSRLTVFDESILPEGCDPKLFALTFELRSQRHEIEKSIENIKKKQELLNKSLCLAYTGLETIENELKQYLDKLEAYRIKKQLKLNDVETTIVLNKSQMTKANVFNSSILVYANVMQILTNRVVELKKEREDIIDTYKNEKLIAKQLRTEINSMDQVLKKYKVAIKDEMIKKFKMETDWNFIDDMEMAIINYMIIQSKSHAEETKEHFIKEIKLLENQIRAHQEILTDLLGAHTVKNITLKAVCEGTQQLHQSLSVQQNNNKIVQDLVIKSQNTYDDMATLKEVYDSLSNRKHDISKEIHMLKYKGKMFPPIGRQPCPKSFSTSTVVSFRDLIEEEEQEEEEEVSWMTGGDEERRYYDIEFNVEPKTSFSRRRPLSSRSSSHRTVYSSERANGWENPHDETRSSISDGDGNPGAVAVSKITVKVNDILGERKSDGDEYTGSNKNL